MRKLVVTLSLSAAIAACAAGLPAVAQASALAQTQARAVLPADGGSAAVTARAATDPFSFSTKMISFAPIDMAPQGLSAGDSYVVAGLITRNGKSDGLATAQCTYTLTKSPVLRLCTVDYAFTDGLLVTSGFINGPAQGAPVTLVVVGGTGAFLNVRGYGTLQPTSTGSDVTLQLSR
jgi:hypothetical protein